MTIERTPLNGPQSEECDNKDLQDSHSQKTKDHKNRSILLDTWLLESLALSFSIACFVSMLGVLAAYNNKPRPEFAYKITLNTIISVLATGCKSSLGLVIGEAICQLKWLWFRESRPLFGMQKFDAASRGPLGSFILVINHRGRSFVCIGATLVVLLLVFDPFIQQVLGYPLKSIADPHGIGGALVPQAQGFIQANVEVIWEQAIIQGIWSNEEVQFHPTCSTGNCTWGKFPSLGVCSQCADVTSIAKLNCSLPSRNETFNVPCRITLPYDWMSNEVQVGGFDITNHLDSTNTSSLTLPDRIIWERYGLDFRESDKGYFRVDGESPHNSTNIFAGIDNPMAAYAYAEIDVDSDPIPLNASVSNVIVLNNVTECSYTVCVRDYNVSVTNGVTNISTSKPDLGKTFWKLPPDGSIFSDIDRRVPCWRPNDTHATSNQPYLNFTFCDHNGDRMRLLSENSYGIFTTINKQRWGYSGGMLGFGPEKQLYGERSGISANGDRIVTNGFNTSIEQVAASLTELFFQDTPWVLLGKANVDQVFVSVQWAWLSLPAALVFIGTFFFLLTTYFTRQMSIPLWKSSALASFYHGLERAEDQSYTTNKEMEQNSEETEVRMQYSTNYERLMLRQRFSPVVTLPRSRTNKTI